MADPLSIGASVVDITVPALYRNRLPLDDLQSITDAPMGGGQRAGGVGARSEEESA